jgi:hypothetical protein
MQSYMEIRMQQIVSRSVLFGIVVLLAACGDAARVATAPDRGAVAPLAPSASSRNERSEGRHDARIVRATGDITAAVNEYRDLLGSLNPNIPGEQPSGRREINWDGVPAALTNNDLFPGNFFNVNSPRGVLFTTEGSAFRISSNGYVDVNSHYAGEFNVFSPPKLFVARGSTITDVQFVVAGSNTPALVTGFGSVFGDVGREHSTTIEYFDAEGRRLLSVKAPRRSDDVGLSFVGAVFDSPIVARVRITSGDTPIDATAFDNVHGAGPKHDIVVMDDFIYGEPHASK